MKKNNFLGSTEEKVIYPISRTSGRIFALLIFVIVAAAALFLLYNSTPTERRDVAISNNEMLKNKIDTTTIKTESNNQCDAGEYQSEYEKLKSNIPNGEWYKLTDTIQIFDGYDYITQYDVWYGSYQTYAPKYRKEVIKNASALPNQLLNLYENKGIDSSNFCEKAAILKVINKTCEITNADIRLQAFDYMLNIFYQSDKISTEQVDDAQSIWKKTHPGLSALNEWKHITSFGRVLNSIAIQKPSAEKIQIITKLIDENEKLSYAKKQEDQENYEDIPSLIIENEIPEEDLSIAADDFIKEINFHTQLGFVKSAKRYFRLYNEKWNIYEMEKKRKANKKGDFRLISGAVIGGGILALLLLSIVLLLFSINRSLSNRS